jgi:putative membrane protein insertion efficiency factor
MSLSRILMGLIKGYQYLLSPLFGQQCRYYPTCSQYALDAIEQHGAIKGSYYTTHRLLRCHPWCAGGHDPIP